jgi:hypothetical protein
MSWARTSRASIAACAASVVVCILGGWNRLDAQVRGVYPLGMSALNSGVTPEPGFSYANQLLFYSRSELKGPDGEPVQTGNNSVILAMNSIVWVGSRSVLGGARFSMSATLPLSNNSLTSDASGAIGGGGGFADSYYQPVILGWSRPRADIRAVYGFLAPTGDYDVDSNQNVGSGYWTHALSSGQTWRPTSGGSLTISTFQMYEFHTTQSGTGITPGDAFNLDYSIMHAMSAGEGVRLQFGVAGYHQRQTTAKQMPVGTTQEDDARYEVNALGVAASLAWPKREVALSFKYLEEFANRATFQGFSTQIAGSIAF